MTQSIDLTKVTIVSFKKGNAVMYPDTLKLNDKVIWEKNWTTIFSQDDKSSNAEGLSSTTGQTISYIMPGYYIEPDKRTRITYTLYTALNTKITSNTKILDGETLLYTYAGIDIYCSQLNSRTNKLLFRLSKATSIKICITKIEQKV